MTPTSEVDNIVRIYGSSPGGKALIMRSTDAAAPFVCNVAMTRIPISAAVSARWMVSWSRISPTRITSGSSRNADIRAREKEGVCVPTSRWLKRHCFALYMYSTGSSIVMTWPRRSELIKSIMAASVVDLPEPVGPVTRIRPLRCRVRFFSTGGRPSWFRVETLVGTTRKTAPIPPMCWKTLIRKRALPS